MADIVVAVLHQKLAAPAVDGAVRPPKPGGYRDSAADIAYALQHGAASARGALRLVTPAAHPQADVDADWSFADDEDGVAAALAAAAAAARGVHGAATVLWANTALFAGHAGVAAARAAGAVVLGQSAESMDAMDDKRRTNARLHAAGLPVPRSVRVALDAGAERAAADAAMRELASAFPVVLKPVRGRGSEGVVVVRNADDLARRLRDAAATRRFGDAMMLEEFLPGREVTVAVLPPGAWAGAPWSSGFVALPVVERTGHRDDVMPYNGHVPVALNSAVVRGAEFAPLARACERAMQLVGATAVGRIDCRQRADGTFCLFDLNGKPNMTGGPRPGRAEHVGLLAMALEACHYSFSNFCVDAVRNAAAATAAARPTDPAHDA